MALRVSCLTTQVSVLLCLLFTRTQTQPCFPKYNAKPICWRQQIGRVLRFGCFFFSTRIKDRGSTSPPMDGVWKISRPPLGPASSTPRRHPELFRRRDWLVLRVAGPFYLVAYIPGAGRSSNSDQCGCWAKIWCVWDFTVGCDHVILEQFFHRILETETEHTVTKVGNVRIWRDWDNATWIFWCRLKVACGWIPCDLLQPFHQVQTYYAGKIKWL